MIKRATNAYANRSAMVQPSFKVASATAISVLYQRLKLMLLVKPPYGIKDELRELCAALGGALRSGACETRVLWVES